MCQQLSLNANVSTDVKFSFGGLATRAEEYKDGSGSAFFENRGLRHFIEHHGARSSPVAELVKRYAIKSDIVIAHIGKATKGRVALENTHPFVHEKSARAGRHRPAAQPGVPQPANRCRKRLPRLPGAALKRPVIPERHAAARCRQAQGHAAKDHDLDRSQAAARIAGLRHTAGRQRALNDEYDNEIAPALMGDDPNGIARRWDKPCWVVASMGHSGLATQVIAAFDIALWDLMAKRATLRLFKLLGAQRENVPAYTTSGGFLSSHIEDVLDNVEAAIARGIGGCVALVLDANQQWDRTTSQRFGKLVEALNLTWIEEPLDVYDADGYATLVVAMLDAGMATGEMVTSVAEHAELIRHRSVDFIQPDAARVSDTTPMLKTMALSIHARIRMAPHFAMQIHLHLSASYAHGPWIEHFEWLEPMFNERLRIADGRSWVPDRPGLGFSLSEQARAWTRRTVAFGKQP